MDKYKFCPRCKNDLISSKNSYSCNHCGLKIYQNPKPCVSALPVKDGKVLLSRRANEPFKGEYDLIGGFMNVEENVEEALRREVKEETGLDIKIVKLLGTYPDRYGKGGDYTINLQFIVEITGGILMAKDDISSLEWVQINNLPEINGFNNTKETLKDLQEWYKTL